MVSTVLCIIMLIPLMRDNMLASLCSPDAGKRGRHPAPCSQKGLHTCAVGEAMQDASGKKSTRHLQAFHNWIKEVGTHTPKNRLGHLFQFSTLH